MSSWKLKEHLEVLGIFTHEICFALIPFDNVCVEHEV